MALQFLRNSEIAAKGVLPTCQDTGTAIIVGKKGQRVWTGGGDEEALSKGVYNTYIEDNLRYSQNAALDMYKAVSYTHLFQKQIFQRKLRTALLVLKMQEILPFQDVMISPLLLK